jgi:hypothetical protein
MPPLRPVLVFLLFLPLAGCSARQQSQLANCDAAALAAFPKPPPGQPLKAIQACMDKAGYRFIGWNEGVVCDLNALIRARSTQGAAICFEPKNWLALKLYRLEVPEKAQMAPPT